ncbi:MAG: c-type cytochrome, partial [Phycisphaerae bacterium]
MRRSSIIQIGICMPACMGLFWGCFAVPDGTDPTGPSGGGPGTPGGGSGGDAAHGAALYADRGCSACHAQDGSGGFGPSLLSVDLATLDMMLRDPGTSHPGGLFADLTDQDLEDLLAFLAPVVTDTPNGPGSDGGGVPGNGGGGTTPPGGGSDSAANGASIFAAEGCINCHGADGSGGFGPSLLSVDFATLNAKLRDPAVSHGGGKFPHLTDQDLEDLLAFLAPVVT